MRLFFSSLVRSMPRNLHVAAWVLAMHVLIIWVMYQGWLGKPNRDKPAKETVVNLRITAPISEPQAKPKALPLVEEKSAPVAQPKQAAPTQPAPDKAASQTATQVAQAPPPKITPVAAPTAPEAAHSAPATDQPVITAPAASTAASTQSSAAANTGAGGGTAVATGFGDGKVTPPSSTADYLNNPKPPYPPMSRRMGEQGSVKLRILVGVDGLPQKVELSNSSGYERLDKAALDAAMRWTYVPGKRAGKIEAMWMQSTISFVLEQ